MLILFQLSNVDKMELGSVADSVSSWTSGKSSSEQFSPPPQPDKSRPIGPTMIGPAMIGPLPVRIFMYTCMVYYAQWTIISSYQDSELLPHKIIKTFTSLMLKNYTLKQDYIIFKRM